MAQVVCAVVKRLRGPGASVFALQLVRSALSVPANVAEGYGRGPGKDCCRFLKIARSSAAEVESHLRVAVLAGYLTEMEAAAAIQASRSARYLIGRLVSSMEERVA